VTRALLAAAAVALLAPSAGAAESPRWGSFDLAIGTYRPDVDSEFAAPPRPYQQIFGSKKGWMFRFSVARAIFTQVGSLEAGLSAGYFQQTGKGLFTAGGISGDETKFKMVPASAFLQYRFDWLAERYKVPLAPYGRVALERYHWWVTDGNGDTAKDGATNGWSVAGGVALLLDVLDPSLARELDEDSGVNHTYLFAEVKRAQVDDFGSSKSWDLSDTAFSGGLMFAF
jgi:hypothetical protein